jgi:hypothetical protein
MTRPGSSAVFLGGFDGGRTDPAAVRRVLDRCPRQESNPQPDG